MRVKELIEKLKDANPDAFVNVYFDHFSYQNILKSSEDMNHRCITLTIKDVKKSVGDDDLNAYINCEYKRYIPESQKYDGCNEYWE